MSVKLHIKQDFKKYLSDTKNFKNHKAQIRKRKDNGSKGGRDDERRNRSILEIGPDRRAVPKAMGHNILKINFVVEGQSGPRLEKCVEVMSNLRD